MFFDLLKTLPQFCMPKRTMTQLAGKLANLSSPRLKNTLIRYFIKKYGVNMAEAREENPEAYRTFNDFFIRTLKPSCRPLARADIVSPVDGSVSEYGSIERGQILQAKGHRYRLQSLLACEPAECNPFLQGQFATLYLSPKDYHRIHMPMTGTLIETRYVPGRLFSVQPTTARIIPDLFARNERLVTLFETPTGPMAIVLVGATIVGSMGTVWDKTIPRSENILRTSFTQQPITLQQGEEMGHFKLGSTVIVLLPETMPVQWLLTGNPSETVRYGQALGQLLHA